MPGMLKRQKVVGIKGMEFRPFGEVRSINEEEGVVEAYLTKWNTVDSYNSTFKRGAFKKTFKERSGKIKLLFNHETLCGKVVEAREDHVGPWVKCQFNLETTAGKDGFAHVRAGDVDAFSFGFTVQKSQGKNGVREISEVACMECGPVIFPANEEASIIAYRSALEAAGRITIEEETDEEGEERAEDFDDTLEDSLLMSMGWKMNMALEDTLEDIWWNSDTADEVIAKLDEAIMKYHATYIQWARDFTSRFWGETRSLPTSNVIAAMMQKYAGNVEELAKRTSLTMEELEELRHGNILPFESRTKLKELPPPVADAHHQLRCERVEELCAEFRARGFSKVESMRFGALLGITEPTEEKRKTVVDEDSKKEIRSLMDSINSLSFTTPEKKENTEGSEE